MLELAFRRPPGQGLRVLCLGAHSDDIEIGCGGTILRLLASRSDVAVRWVVFSGSAERAEEARRSAELFLRGAAQSAVDVHSFRDGFFPYEGARIKEVFESLKDGPGPDVIFTHRGRDRHQDHRLISELTWNTFRDHLVLEYEIPKYDGDLGRPNAYIALSAAQVERKVALLLEHFPSQHARRWFDAETFRSLLRLRGMECNAPERYAEAFHSPKQLW